MKCENIICVTARNKFLMIILEVQVKIKTKEHRERQIYGCKSWGLLHSSAQDISTNLGLTCPMYSRISCWNNEPYFEQYSEHNEKKLFSCFCIFTTRSPNWINFIDFNRQSNQSNRTIEPKVLWNATTNMSVVHFKLQPSTKCQSKRLS